MKDKVDTQAKMIADIEGYHNNNLQGSHDKRPKVCLAYSTYNTFVALATELPTKGKCSQL